MLWRVEQGAVRYLERFRSWEFLPSLPKGRKKDDTREFLMGQAGAEQALSEGKVLLAFDRCWDTIKKHVLMVPREAEPYLIWLTGQIAYIREQGELPAEIASIRDEVLAWIPLFAKVGIGVAPGFLPEGFVMPEFQIVQEKG